MEQKPVFWRDLLELNSICQADVFEYLPEIGFEGSLELPVDGYRKINTDFQIRVLPSGRHGTP
jgi:hypothetical protein